MQFLPAFYGRQEFDSLHVIRFLWRPDEGKFIEELKGLLNNAGLKNQRRWVVSKLFCGLFVGVFLAYVTTAAQKEKAPSTGKAKMKKELLYFANCPSYKQALANIKAALKEKNLQAELIMVDVESEARAKEVGFQGSPSVRINGKDLEGRDEGFSFSCRIYTVNGKPAAAPSKESIITKIDSLMK